MKVKYSYLEEQFAVSEPILKNIRKLVKTADYTLGEPVLEFEGKFAALCKVKYAIGVNSGTDALFLGMKAAGIGQGDEVISAPNSFIATTGAIIATGAKPVYVDVNEKYNINPCLIKKAITKKTKAIIPVHYAGCPADMADITEIAEKYKLYIIEDACQAISAAIDGKPVGNFGICAGFSLHPLKNLNVWGDAGVVVTNSEEIKDKLMLLRNHGLKNRDEVEVFGYNSRLDSIQAIVGNHLIKSTEKITNKRIAYAKIYDRELSKLDSYIKIPPRDKYIRHVFHIYIVQVKHRNELYKYLNSNGIEAKIHYPIPLHLQKAAKYLGYKKGDFPVCEKQAEYIISLPVHQHLTNEQIFYVIEKIRRFYKV